MNVKSKMKLLKCITLLFLINITLCWKDNYFHGISQVAFVVANLEEATTWYTDILGGMLVPKLSTGNVNFI